MKRQTRLQQRIELRRKIINYIHEHKNETGSYPPKCDICHHFGITWKFLTELIDPEILNDG